MFFARCLSLVLISTTASCAEGFNTPAGTGGAAGGGGDGQMGGEGGTSQGGQPSGGTSPGGGGEGGDGGDGGEGGASDCSEDPCKLVAPQCGCDAGDKCTVGSTGTRSCDAEGTVALGGACGASDCVAGGICLGGASAAFCAEFCDVDSDCGGGQICGVRLSDGMGGSVDGVGMCSSSCDPESGSGCPAAMGCIIGQEEAAPMRFFFTCFPAGSGTSGAACASADDCAVGFGCYSDGVGTVCLRHCNVNTQACPGVEFCYGLVDQNDNPVVVNGYEVGVCQ